MVMIMKMIIYMITKESWRHLILDLRMYKNPKLMIQKKGLQALIIT